MANFKLTKNDKETLLRIGYLEQDLEQIEEGINTGTITHCKRVLGTRKYKEHKISIRTALKYVSREQFLASCGRASFHWNTSDEIQKCSESSNSYLWGYCDECIRYDMSNLFK